MSGNANPHWSLGLGDRWMHSLCKPSRMLESMISFFFMSSKTIQLIEQCLATAVNQCCRCMILYPITHCLVSPMALIRNLPLDHNSCTFYEPSISKSSHSPCITLPPVFHSPLHALFNLTYPSLPFSALFLYDTAHFSAVLYWSALSVFSG